MMLSKKLAQEKRKLDAKAGVKGVLIEIENGGMSLFGEVEKEKAAAQSDIRKSEEGNTL
jgi:hypothetical protein